MLVTVEVLQDEALNLLLDMERLELIRVNSSSKNSIAPGKKLSEQFAGALQLSDTDYEAYQNSLQSSRNEWRRDIY